MANGYFSSNVLATGLENEDDPSANTYCIIGALDTSDYLQFDGYYDLKLIYKYSDGTEDVLEWTQTSWLTESSVTGADLTKIVDSFSHVDQVRFRGLALSSALVTYLDGSGADDGNWWHAVASTWAAGGGIPAHELTYAYSSSLWIRPGIVLVLVLQLLFPSYLVSEFVNSICLVPFDRDHDFCVECLF